MLLIKFSISQSIAKKQTYIPNICSIFYSKALTQEQLFDIIQLQRTFVLYLEVLMKQKRRYKNRRRTQLIMRKVFLSASVLLISIGLAFVISVFFSSAKEKNTPTYYKYYTSITIKSGDTLDSIASHYVDNHFESSKHFINEIMIINGLTDDMITSGMNLVIPYYSTEYK